MIDARDCTAPTKGSFRFAGEPERIAALLRDLAGRIESGEVLTSKVETLQRVTGSDFAVDVLQIESHRKDPTE